MPVFITYLTAHADGGQLAFADDVYGLDPRTEALADVQLATAPAKASATDEGLTPVSAGITPADLKLATTPRRFRPIRRRSRRFGTLPADPAPIRPRFPHLADSVTPSSRR